MFDSTKSGLHRLYEQGVTKYDALAAIPADKLQVAIEQLPEVNSISSCLRLMLFAVTFCSLWVSEAKLQHMWSLDQ